MRKTCSASAKYLSRQRAVLGIGLLIATMVVAVGLATLAQTSPSFPVPSSITVYANRSRGKIDTRIFGHFTEETLTSWEGGASSQLLVDRKFSMPEARDPRAPMMRGVGGPWQPVALAGNVTLVQDRVTYYSAPMSERITNSGGGPPAGVQQSGCRLVLPHISRSGFTSEPFRFRRGEQYRARIAIKTLDFTGDVQVALGTSYRNPVARHSISVRGGGDWTTHEFELVPTEEVADGKFMVYIDSPGTIWIDSASLVRSDLDDGGFRTDVMAATRRILPANIRWPGGWFVSDYHWQDGIGPVDKRPSELNRAWGVYYNNDIGVDEYLAFCREVGAEPYIVVNVGSGTPEEAAALVEYANGSPATRWGKARAVNGHPEPYNVRLWNIGNEEYLPTLGGTSAVGYARNYLAFAKAMRAVDPSIELVAVGSFEIPAGLIPPEHPMYDILRYLYNWTSTFLPVAGKQADYYAIHYYEPGDSIHGKVNAADANAAALVIAEDLRRKLDPVFHLVQANKLHLPIALDEWALKMPDNSPDGAHAELPPGTKLEEAGFAGSLLTLRDALAEAGVYNLMQRRPQDFKIGSRTLLYAYLVGLVGIGRDRVVLSPSARMLELYSTRANLASLDVEVQSPRFDVPAIEPFAEVKGANYLDVSARRNLTERTIEVFVVNRNLKNLIKTAVRFPEVALHGPVKVAVLNGSDLNSWNSFDSPDRVTIQESQATAKGSELFIEFQPHSVTRLSLQASEAATQGEKAPH